MKLFLVYYYDNYDDKDHVVYATTTRPGAERWIEGQSQKEYNKTIDDCKRIVRDEDDRRKLIEVYGEEAKEKFNIRMSDHIRIMPEQQYESFLKKSKQSLKDWIKSYGQHRIQEIELEES